MDITELKAIIDANIFENTSQAITGDALNDVLNLIADSLGEYVPVADIFDEAGKIRSALLPSYVDDVLEFSTRDAFPAVGEGGKIYLAADTNLSYRWGGSEYVIIAQSLALGETSSTAYRGDRGKIAYDHSQTSHRLSIAGLEVSALNGSISAAELKQAIGLGDVENIKLSSWAGSTNITTLGAVTTGEWKASKIANDYLVNSTIRIGSTTVALGGAIEALSGIASISLKGDNDAKLTYDNGAWHLSGNLLVDGYITAGGVGSSSGGGGIDSAAMWALLGDATNEQINKTHISSALEGYQSIIPDLATIRNNAANGNTAYGYFTNGKLPYTSVSGTPDLSDMATKTWVNVQGYLKGITSSMVTSALGYTPYNAGNPNGYISGISKAMVENVLTGNITSHTHSYLPLSGGTISLGYGALTLEGGADVKLIFNNTDGEKYQLLSFREKGIEYGHILATTGGLYFSFPKISLNNQEVIHSANYNSYAPTLTGGGASGTWGISITGNAATATNASQLNGHSDSYFAAASSLGNYLPLSGGNITGSLTVQNNTVYHSGNCNNTSTPWSASSLTLNGEINGATTINATTFRPITCVSGNPIRYDISVRGWYRIARINSTASSGTIYLYKTFTNSVSVGVAIQFTRSLTGGFVFSVLSDNDSDIAAVRGISVGEYEAYIEIYYNVSVSNGLLVFAIGSNIDVLQPTLQSGGSGTECSINRGLNISSNVSVSGNILATGAITAGTASDSRLKSNIATLCNASSVLRQLRGVGFDWNALATDKSSYFKGHDVGLIAQEVEPFIPSAIGTIWGEYKRLDYSKITPYLVEGWKEHDDEIQRLKVEIIELKKKIYGLGKQ